MNADKQILVYYFYFLVHWSWTDITGLNDWRMKTFITFSKRFNLSQEDWGVANKLHKDWRDKVISKYE